MHKLTLEILQNPMLWDVDSPNLYNVTACITDARTGENSSVA